MDWSWYVWRFYKSDMIWYHISICPYISINTKKKQVNWRKIFHILNHNKVKPVHQISSTTSYKAHTISIVIKDIPRNSVFFQNEASKLPSILEVHQRRSGSLVRNVSFVSHRWVKSGQYKGPFGYTYCTYIYVIILKLALGLLIFRYILLSRYLKKMKNLCTRTVPK